MCSDSRVIEEWFSINVIFTPIYKFKCHHDIFTRHCKNIAWQKKIQDSMLLEIVPWNCFVFWTESDIILSLRMILGLLF